MNWGRIRDTCGAVTIWNLSFKNERVREPYMKCRIQIRETNSNTFDSYMMVCFVFVIVGLSMVSMCITVIQGSLVCLFVCAIFFAKRQ